MGQVETDDLYVGVDRRGAHYVIPVQAKGGNDILSVVQIEQDIAVCRFKFPSLIARPIAVQFMAENLIAMFELEQDGSGDLVIANEQHYQLVDPDEISPSDLDTYRARTE
jgi:hypothetical protein